MIRTIVVEVPRKVVVEQELVGGQQKDARTAADIGDRKASEVARRLVPDRRPESSSNNSIGNVTRRRTNAAAFANLRLADNRDRPAFDGDHFAQELLVDRAQDLGLDDGERVGALRIVELGNNQL